MKRRKRTLNRKQQAIRWVTVLTLLVCLSHTTGAYCLTAERVLRSLEREQLTGETEFLAQLSAPEPREGTVRLSGGEHAAILATYHWNWRVGWYANLTYYVERKSDWPINAGFMNSWRYDDTGTYYIFGSVEDPEVTQVDAYFDADDDTLDQTVCLTEKDWIKNERGDRFFLCEIRPEQRVMTLDCSVRGYRADGTTVGMLELLPVIPRWE